MNQQRQSHQKIAIQYSSNPPQINIYNRYFYLRNEQHHLLQEQHDRELKQLANKPKITVSSYQILSSQLQKHIQGVLKQFSTEAQYKLQNQMVNFVQFQKIIFKLSNVKESDEGLQMQHFQSQLWLILGSYKLIPELNANIVFAVFRILLDPYNLTESQCEALLKQIDSIKNSNQNREKFILEHPDLKEETLTLSQILKLWKRIRYQNPQFSTLPHRRQNFQQPTFHPELNEKSKLLAKNAREKFMSTHESYLNCHQFSQRKEENVLSKYFSDEGEKSERKKIPYFQILHKRKLEKDMLPKVNIQNMKQENTCHQKNEKYVTPSEVKEIVNNLYVKKQRREDVDHKKKKQEEELVHCTFSPQINDYFGCDRSHSPTIRNYDKYVERMHRGREQKQEKKKALQNLGRVKNAEKYGYQSKRSKVPSFVERDAPKLILQIRIDDNRTEKLSLKGDENKRLVAKKFVNMHGLEGSMIDVLESLIEEQLDTL